MTGPHGVRNHVKKLTATSASAYALCGYDSTYIANSILAAGDYACSHTWMRWRSANTSKPCILVYENKNGGSNTLIASYYAMRVPEDRWVLLRYVKKLSASDFSSGTSYKLFHRHYCIGNGDYQYMWGNSNNIYGSFPLNPMPGNVSAAATTYPTVLVSAGSSTVYGGEQHIGSAVPSDGTWNRGDVVINISPTAGGKLGWICTASGTPGTWKEFGAIDP